MTEEILAKVEEIKARGYTAAREGNDPVNEPMIRHWAEAMGDMNPRWQPGPDCEAPPAMAQVWTMPGLNPERPPGEPLWDTMVVLDDAGYTSVLGTNCDQTYARTLRPGERVRITSRLEEVVGPKKTAVGEGYFVTTGNTWLVGPEDAPEEVATMKFRVLKFKPGTGRPTVDRIASCAGRWSTATRRSSGRARRRASCGSRSATPAACCGIRPARCARPATRWTAATSWRPARAGCTRSSSIMRRSCPGSSSRSPWPWSSSTRVSGWSARSAASRDRRPGRGAGSTGSTTTSPWRSGDEPATRPRQPEPEKPSDIPVWELPITPTLVVSTALATRDFQDVHHDRDLAQGHGSKDIFLNILTTTGLVHRYVTDWAGPQTQVLSCALCLGAPAHPYDTLRFTGDIVSESDGVTTIDVTGRSRSATT